MSPSRALALLPVALLLCLLVGPAHAASAGGSISQVPRTLDTPVPAGGSSATGANWTTYHGGENRSGYTSFLGPGHLEEAWSACPSLLSIRSGPVADAKAIYAADSLGTVYAFNRTHDESVLWKVDLSAQPVDLDVADPYLLVGTTTGGIVALYVNNGTPAWSVGLGSGIVQGVSAYDGSVYVGTVAGSVWGMSLDSGITEWSTLLSSGVAGALSIDQGTIFAPTLSGDVVALSTSGHVEWSTSVGTSIGTAVAVSDGLVVAGDLHGNVTALNESTGALDWRWVGGENDSIHATPAIGDGHVFVILDSERIAALNLSNGSALWVTSPVYSGGYISTGGPALTPNGLYVVLEGLEELVDLKPATGDVIWTGYSFFDFSFGAPAIVGGDVVVGVDNGCVISYGPNGLPPSWPVSGVVESTNGSALSGVLVTLGTSTNLTGADGRFRVAAPNGSYVLTALLPGFALAHVPLLVTGPQAGLTVRLEPLYLYPLEGTVLDQGSGKGVPGATVVAIIGYLGFDATTTTGPDGSFTLLAPNGTVYLSVAPPAGYGGVSIDVNVSGAPVHGVVLVVVPTALSPYSNLPWFELVALFVLPFLALALGAVALRVHSVARARRELGLPPSVLSPFGRYVLMRFGLLPGQIALGLAVLYLFGTVIRAISFHDSPCDVGNTGTCTPSCTWSDLSCSGVQILSGYWLFVSNLFTGNWGVAQYGHLKEPVLLFLQWWLPASVELALVSLTIALVAGYPLGLVAGWRRGGAVDVGARAGALVGLLLPTFLVALLLLLALYQPFLNSFGDAPYGLVPSSRWYLTHGGFPTWIGLGGNTLPTGLPIVDGVIHRDWPFERLVLAKVLFQAVVIGIVYVAIFLRYARNVVVDAARDLHVTAARARGVDDATLLWKHTARRVLPFYLLIFALTLPAFIGTQAIIEVIFSDNGAGTVLIAGITSLAKVAGSLIGFSGQQSDAGSFEQAAVFLLLLVVLGSTLVADVVARWLDPSRREEGR